MPPQTVQGQPHVIPVCFALHEGNLYSVLDQKPKRAPLTRLRRVRNILANPTAALIVDHYQEDWQGLWYILVWGPASLLIEGDESEDERAAAVDVLRRKYRQYREMDIADNPVVKLTPEEWRLGVETVGCPRNLSTGKLVGPRRVIGASRQTLSPEQRGQNALGFDSSFGETISDAADRWLAF